MPHKEHDSPCLLGVLDLLKKIDIRQGKMELQLNRILTKIVGIEKQEKKIMATLDDVLAGVAAESTADDSLIALVVNVKQMLADALAGVTLPPAVQAKVDAVFASVTDNVTKVNAALAATP